MVISDVMYAPVHRGFIMEVFQLLPKLLSQRLVDVRSDLRTKGDVDGQYVLQIATPLSILPLLQDSQAEWPTQFDSPRSAR